MRVGLCSLLAILPLLSLATPVQPPELRIPLTKRKGLTDDSGVINTARLQGEISKVISKVQRGFNAFEKNTGEAHPKAAKISNKKRDTASVPLEDEEGGALWQGSISVGTPATQFTVDFDTGSSDLFLPGTNCRVNCNGHKAYDTNASTTANDLHGTFNLAFGDGSTVTGEKFTDTVTIGSLTATQQTVGAATRYSTGFSIDQFPPDGLMGMGFPQISVFEADPVFQTLVAQGQTTQPVFSFKLATSGSELFLGGIDDRLHSGNFADVSLARVGFWEVNMDAASANGQTAGNDIDSIIDTGTTLVLGDPDTVAALYDAIPGAQDASGTIGAGFFTFPCNSDPGVSLTFGGTEFSISADTFNLGQVSTGSSDCVGGVVSQDGLDFWVIGDVFLQNVYTVFDVGNEQVRFANLA